MYRVVCTPYNKAGSPTDRRDPHGQPSDMQFPPVNPPLVSYWSPSKQPIRPNPIYVWSNPVRARCQSWLITYNHRRNTPSPKCLREWKSTVICVRNYLARPMEPGRNKVWIPAHPMRGESATEVRIWFWISKTTGHHIFLLYIIGNSCFHHIIHHTNPSFILNQCRGSPEVHRALSPFESGPGKPLLSYWPSACP